MSSLTELDLVVMVFKETNTLAYLPAASIKKKKSFIIVTTRKYVLNFFEDEPNLVLESSI